MIPVGIVAGSGQGTFPSAVSVSSISNTYNSATLNWTAPFNGGSPITGYSYQLSTDNVNWGSATSAGTGTSYTVTGLNPVTTYYFRMRATNSIGAGSYGSSSSTTTPKADLLINSATADGLSYAIFGPKSGTSLPDQTPFYIAVTGLRRTDGTPLSGKTLQIQFNILGGGTWYNITNATMVTDASGNAQRNIWYQPGVGGSPVDYTTYTSGYNGYSGQGADIVYGMPEISENRWRVVFAGDSTDNAVTSGQSGIMDFYYPGS